MNPDKIKVKETRLIKTTGAARQSLSEMGIHRKTNNAKVVITQACEVGVSFIFNADAVQLGFLGAKEYHISARHVMPVFHCHV